ncbi:MAG TPA: GatB/YqeY domain-containing protein [Clostridiaceae bacterium]|nr:GatB/YqeY domain-containing protein [Clostridiaceae bacterium]
MSLKETLLEDLKNAMKEKDIIRKNVVQMIRSAVLQVEKDKQVTLDDDGVLEVISKELKKRKDILPDYEKSGRQDLIDNLNYEISILLQYLPKQLDEAEIEEIVMKAVKDVGATSVKDMGKVMQVIMPQIKGKADGKVVNQIVKKVLG